MIRSDLGQNILNKLLLTSGSTGTTKEEDRTSILATKYVIGTEHEDYNASLEGTDKDERKSCAYFPLEVEYFTIEKGVKGGTYSSPVEMEGRPTEDKIKIINPNESVDEAIKQLKNIIYIKIPIKAGTNNTITLSGIAVVEEIVKYINSINKRAVDANSIQKYYIRPVFDGAKPKITDKDFTEANQKAMDGLKTLSEFTNSAFYSSSKLELSETEKGIAFKFNYPTFKSNTEYYKDTSATRPTVENESYSRFQGVSEIEYGAYNFPETYFYSSATRQQNNYPSKAFIGLFTTMPNPDGTQYAEPTPYSLDNPGLTYRRMNLHESLFSGDTIFDEVEKEESVTEHLGKAKIKNKEIIMFPEVLGASWGTIKGFGIFNEEAVGTGTPYFWGTVQQSKVASEETVPLFRPEEFIIYLG